MGRATDGLSTQESRFGDVEVELVQLAFHNILITLALAWVAMIGTSSLLAHLYHDADLWCLDAISSTISLLRVFVVAAFHRRDADTMTRRSASRWITLHSALTLASFTGNAAHTLYNFGHHDNTGRVIWMVGTLILCAGLSGRASARPRADQAALTINTGALMWCVAHSGQRFGWLVCLMLVMFLYGVCASVQNRFDITVEQLRTRRKLRDLANHDVLTGLANRRRFETALNQHCGQSAAFAVLFLDLDGFKQVNDNLGHATGDILLELVAQRLQGIVRPTDLIARLGGDEFAVLHAPDANEATAAALAGRIIETLSAPYEIDSRSVCIGTSIGIQLAAQETANDPKTLLADADRALYIVKQSGKGYFRFATSAESVEVTQDKGRAHLLGVTSQFA